MSSTIYISTDIIIDWNGTNFVVNSTNYAPTLTVVNTLTNNTMLTVTIALSNPINANNVYLIAGSDNLTFDGALNLLQITGTSEYPGFISNSNHSNNFIKKHRIIKLR